MMFGKSRIYAVWEIFGSRVRDGEGGEKMEGKREKNKNIRKEKKGKFYFLIKISVDL